MSFSLVTGIGHCGTKWLSTVLHRPARGVICYHELSHLLTIPQWQARQPYARKNGVGRRVFPKYWRQIDSDLAKYKFVCDSMSWCSIEAVEVGNIGKAGKIIYLVRDGIQQLHSVVHKSLWKDMPDDHFLYQDFLKMYWEIAGKPYKEWSKWDRWEKLCLWWATNEFMPQWMINRFDGVVEVYRLEDLITNTHFLEKITRRYDLNFGEQKLKRLQEKDVNRKVQGDRRPVTLWGQWSQKEREAFCAVCGKGMLRYNYSQGILSG